jgi:UDP-3-O-[3-hydroxymyristoyl] glucosamine N-acyltransferase
MRMTLAEIAGLVGGRLVGDGAVEITGVAGLAEAGPADLSFLSNSRYAPLLASSRAGGVVLREEHAPLCSRPAVVVKDPDWAFAVAAERFGPPPVPPPPGVHPLACVASGARIGEGVSVGPYAVVEEGAAVGDGTIVYPFVYIGREAEIGPACVLHPGVVVRERVRIGRRVILHGGVVVGADGFGYAVTEGAIRKIPQAGTVVIEDDVEVGSNTTIDRARFGVTRIGRGTKIDNLVMIAHNVEIGRDCLFAAQTGISGSTKVGHGVWMGGQVGLAGHLEIGDGVKIGAQSGVAKSQPAGAVIDGTPARPIAPYHRAMAALHRLPQLVEEVRALRAELERLKAERGQGRDHEGREGL